MRAIITPAEVSSLARPCYADNEIVLSIIAEAEREDIKPRIGDRLYLSLKKDDTTLLTDEETLLLNGGSWTSTDGAEHYLEGLKTALAYFVYSRIVRDGNIQSTRYGARIKTDDNSTSSEDTERQRQYRQAFSSADRYLTECLGFINQSSTLCGGVVKVMKSNRTRFKVLNGNGADAPSFRSSSASGQLTGDKVIEALGYTPVTPTQLAEVEDEIPDVSNLQEKLTDEQIANINDVPNKASTTYVDNHHDSTKQNALTETQMQAVNSGITSAKLTTLESHDVVAQPLQLSDQAKSTARQNINADEKMVTATSQPSGGFKYNAFYNLGVLEGSHTFALATTTSITDECVIQFSTGDTAPSITWFVGVSWYGGSAPTINANKGYRIAVCNGLAICGEF